MLFYLVLNIDGHLFSEYCNCDGHVPVCPKFVCCYVLESNLLSNEVASELNTTNELQIYLVYNTSSNKYL